MVYFPTTPLTCKDGANFLQRPGATKIPKLVWWGDPGGSPHLSSGLGFRV